mmetsp:Transcript_17848/g.45681  ORF Transcript_17848/g.45681 Transcript_17848/m.45681 type:complete len:289 (-) Transcript_17848:361-1227(-)
MSRSRSDNASDRSTNKARSISASVPTSASSDCMRACKARSAGGGGGGPPLLPRLPGPDLFENSEYSSDELIPSHRRTPPSLPSPLSLSLSRLFLNSLGRAPLVEEGEPFVTSRAAWFRSTATRRRFAAIASTVCSSLCRSEGTSCQPTGRSNRRPAAYPHATAPEPDKAATTATPHIPTRAVQCARHRTATDKPVSCAATHATAASASASAPSPAGPSAATAAAPSACSASASPGGAGLSGGKSSAASVSRQKAAESGACSASAATASSGAKRGPSRLPSPSESCSQR